jgi:hypothetical protein
MLLADLFQTVRQLEDVGEVLLGVSRDMFPEVVVFKVAGRFLPMTRSTGDSAVAR